MQPDSHSRSFAKALSWRVFALAITTGVSFMLSESVAVAVSIGVVDSAIKIGAYYLHERAWVNVRFGRKPPVAAVSAVAVVAAPVATPRGA